jgi:hypothetical protein
MRKDEESGSHTQTQIVPLAQDIEVRSINSSLGGQKREKKLEAYLERALGVDALCVRVAAAVVDQTLVDVSAAVAVTCEAI